MVNPRERVFIIEPIDGSGGKDEQYSEEIRSLVLSADAEPVETAFARVREVNPATYVGQGKLREFREWIELDGKIDTVVFDGELTPSQTLNVSEALGGISVVDRTTLILDIFARRAVSGEGKLQVELAQLKYLYPRLKGKGSALSRLGGGIGTRGPGETKLETDRRHIRTRIAYLEDRLKTLETRRELQKNRRKKNEFKTVALVGYTNAGKSTLMNALTNAGVLAEDRLFATLDPTFRRLCLPSQTVALADTVGFVRDLPHQLVRAFRSTLESARSADLLLVVIDASSSAWREQLDTTEATLSELGATAPQLKVFNKCDLVHDFSEFPAGAIFLSASENRGTDRLLKAADALLSEDMEELTFFVPFGKIGEYKRLYGRCSVKSEAETDGGLAVTCLVRASDRNLFQPFLEK